MARVTLSKFLAGRQIFTIAEAQAYLQVGKDNRRKSLSTYGCLRWHQ